MGGRVPSGPPRAVTPAALTGERGEAGIFADFGPAEPSERRRLMNCSALPGLTMARLLAGRNLNCLILQDVDFIDKRA